MFDKSLYAVGEKSDRMLTLTAFDHTMRIERRQFYVNKSGEKVLTLFSMDYFKKTTV